MQHSQTSPQQYPAYVQRVNTSPQQYLQPENTTPQAAEVLQQSGQPSRNYRPTNMTAPVLDTQQCRLILIVLEFCKCSAATCLDSRQPEHTPISDQPPPGQIPQHSSAPAIHQEGPSAQQQTMGANVSTLLLPHLRLFSVLSSVIRQIKGKLLQLMTNLPGIWNLLNV